MTSKRIMLVGEAWGEHESRLGRPFAGPAGAMLDAFLKAHGIVRSDCYITNVFNFQPPYNKILSLCGPKTASLPEWPVLQKGKYVRAEFKPEIDRLLVEVESVNPNVIIALGGTACWALLRNGSIKKLRGSPSIGITGHKVFPTYHPSAVLREYKLRPIVFSDFKKIVKEAEHPHVIRPERTFWIEPTLEDLAAFDAHIAASEWLSLDIETWNRQITCVGFAPSTSLALVVPFVYRGHKSGNYWPSLSQEMSAWAYVRRWCGMGKKVIGQNILYDCNYLWKIYGIPVYHVWDDTMLLQHAAQPEMEKSLAFLSSIYTTEPQHKYMRGKVTTLKKED